MTFSIVTGTLISQLQAYTGSPASLLVSGTVFPFTQDKFGSPVTKSINAVQMKDMFASQFQPSGTYITGSFTLLNGRYQPSGTSAPTSSYERDFISGLKMTWVSSGTISVGSGLCMSEGGSSYSCTGTISFTLTGTSSNTWLHIYMAANNQFQYSTTAPTTNPYLGTARSKTGDVSQRYIGSVRTYAVNSAFQFMHDPRTNLITYNGSTLVGSSPHRALNGGTSTVATEVDLSSVIPPIVSKIGYLRMLNTADRIVNFGDTSAVNGVALNIGNTAAQNAFSNAPLTETPGHYYKFPSAVGAGGAYIDVYGYYYER